MEISLNTRTCLAPSSVSESCSQKSHQTHNNSTTKSSPCISHHNRTTEMSSIRSYLLTFILFIVFSSTNFSVVKCNPLLYEPATSLLGASPYQMPLHHQMLIAPPQFDPYSMAAASQYMYAPSPFMPFPFDSSRRSNGAQVTEPTTNRNKHSKKLTDEQKALGDLPVSFLDNDEPSTLTERLSDSLSALGDGVRNHFRSISENFSDTVDDIKDAWRPSENSKKRG